MKKQTILVEGTKIPYIKENSSKIKFQAAYIFPSEGYVVTCLWTDKHGYEYADFICCSVYGSDWEMYKTIRDYLIGQSLSKEDVVSLFSFRGAWFQKD